jgi:hypothetical protein
MNPDLPPPLLQALAWRTVEALINLNLMHHHKGEPHDH